MRTAFDLSGRSALIVGAGGGIGRATAEAFAAMGAELVLADLAAPVELAEAIASRGRSAQALACNVVDTAARDDLVARHAGVDILVYLAAISPWDDWAEPGWDQTFDEVIAVNLKAPLQIARSLMPRMAERGWGRVVLVGSLAGRMGGLIAGGHYVASKGGLHAAVKWLAKRGGPANVLVNGVAPASTDTPMMVGRPVDLSRIPLGRMSRPEEVAWPIAFLCSEAASYVCGTTLDVNGGVYMS
jgi:NAD(P)-dependent dehydrogenase (short-subunit alcohol dehydrogenase family)